MGKVKVYKKLEWHEIKIGQAFYYYGCEGIAVKTGEFDLFIVADMRNDNIGRWKGKMAIWGCDLYYLSSYIRKGIEPKY